MTPSELRHQYQYHNKDGHFFDYSTMRFFGDTMKNYRVIDRGNCWELARKKSVNGNLKSSTYFSKIDYDSNCNLEFFKD